MKKRREYIDIHLARVFGRCIALNPDVSAQSWSSDLYAKDLAKAVGATSPKEGQVVRIRFMQNDEGKFLYDYINEEYGNMLVLHGADEPWIAAGNLFPDWWLGRRFDVRSSKVTGRIRLTLRGNYRGLDRFSGKKS